MSLSHRKKCLFLLIRVLGNKKLKRSYIIVSGRHKVN